MNEGVKILLERIKTNPEEFIYNPATGMSRWQRLVDHALADEIATEEESKALKNALREAKRDRFTEQVMKELLAPEEDDSLGKPWYTNRGNATVSVGVTPVVPSITLEHNEHLRAHLDALHKVEVRKKPVLKKQHKTLFGKLFNYS